MKNQTDPNNDVFSNIIQPKTFKTIIAGGVSGAIEVSITYPIEYVKTQLQLEQKIKNENKEKRFSGFFDCIQKTVKENGFIGLYRGSTVLFVGSIPKTAVRFSTYETFCSFAKDSDEISLGNRALCGLGAGFMEAVLVVTPMETIKVKVINDQRQEKPRFKGFLHGIKLIYKENGVRGLYQGVFPTILRQSTNQSVRFFVVEACKDAYKKNDPTRSPPKLLIGCFGALAGAISVLSNTPIDVVKTRLQGLDAKRYKGTFDCFVQVWKNEGPKAFYTGTVPRLARVCLDVSVTFMVYDLIFDLLNQIWY